MIYPKTRKKRTALIYLLWVKTGKVFEVEDVVFDQDEFLRLERLMKNDKSRIYHWTTKKVEKGLW